MFQELEIPLDQICINPKNGGDVEKFDAREMGIGVGSKEYVNKCIRDDIGQLGVKFKTINVTAESDRQLALDFLRNIIPGTANYFIKNYTPTESGPIRKFYNEEVKEALCNIMGRKRISELSLMIAKLMMKNGGLGIMNSDRKVYFAYVASFTLALQWIIKYNPEVEGMLKMTNIDNHEGA
jgi:hypothetical protein